VILIPSFGNGLERAFAECVSGLITVAVVQSLLASSGNIVTIIVVNLIFIAGIIFLIDIIPYWSITYLLGWIIGIIFLGTKTTLLSWWEIPIYLLVGGFFLYVKLKNKF